MTTYVITRTPAENQYLANSNDTAIWTNLIEDAARFNTLEIAEQEAADWQDFFAMKGAHRRVEAERVPDLNDLEIGIDVDKNENRSINLVPSWKAAAQIYIMAIENGTAEGPAAGRDGIYQMADAIDSLNKKAREQADKIADLEQLIKLERGFK